MYECSQPSSNASSPETTSTSASSSRSTSPELLEMEHSFNSLLAGTREKQGHAVTEKDIHALVQGTMNPKEKILYQKDALVQLMYLTLCTDLLCKYSYIISFGLLLCERDIFLFGTKCNKRKLFSRIRTAHLPTVHTSVLPPMSALVGVLKWISLGNRAGTRECPMSEVGGARLGVPCLMSNRTMTEGVLWLILRPGPVQWGPMHHG